LVALDQSGLAGRIRGRDGDVAFREALGEAGVVVLGQDEDVSVGRKFRHALVRLGFLYPLLVDSSRRFLIGRPDAITPAGRRFIDAQSTEAIQESFLRAISGVGFSILPNKNVDGGYFSPLRHVLRVLDSLLTIGLEPSLTLIEFAAFVQISDSRMDPRLIAGDIGRFRSARLAAISRKHFDTEALDHVVNSQKPFIRSATHLDYADMNFRWLRGTGLFSQNSGALSVAPQKQRTASAIANTSLRHQSVLEYWETLTNGPTLPLDDIDLGSQVLNDLLLQARERGIEVELELRSNPSFADLRNARHDLEARISEFDETAFGRGQFAHIQEISGYLSLMEKGGRGQFSLANSEVRIPRGEAPAYLEWCIWRAFLALNHMQNSPSDARRFRVDRDLRPLDHAPGGGTDLVIEFDDLVVAVEATLLTSGRQEAAEGYPVRQHVHLVRRAQQPDDPRQVVGLFVAPQLNLNTVQTFQRGEFIDPDTEEETRVAIVPLTVEQFHKLFLAATRDGVQNSDKLKGVLRDILSARDDCKSAKSWLELINQTVQIAIKNS
jgi:hypothetical protein